MDLKVTIQLEERAVQLALPSFSIFPGLLCESLMSECEVP